MATNTLNLRQVSGGKRIKQADQSSMLAYKLYDDNYELLPKIDGQEAVIKLYQDDTAYFQDVATVVNGCVSFKISEPLPVGLYIVEVSVAGYVFPSDRQTTVEIVEGATKYEVKELLPVDLQDLNAEVLSLRQAVENVKKGDTESILAEIERLERLVGGFTPYDDSSLREQIRELSGRPEIASYDDTEIKRLVNELSAKIDNLTDNDTIYDDSALVSAIDTINRELTRINQTANTSTPYDDTAIRNSLAQLSERIDNLPAPQAYDDSDITSRLEAVEQSTSASYDDTSIRQALITLTAEVERLSLKASGTTDQIDSKAIVGTGRPDSINTIPEGLREIVQNAEDGTTFTSTDGNNVGAYQWSKRNGKWILTEGDTGWRLLDKPAGVNFWNYSFLAIRRVNDKILVHVSDFNVSIDNSSHDIWRNPVTGWRGNGRSTALLFNETDISGRLIQKASGYEIHVEKSGQWLYGFLEVYTSDPWPSTLPGTSKR